MKVEITLNDLRLAYETGVNEGIESENNNNKLPLEFNELLGSMILMEYDGVPEDMPTTEINTIKI